ncbi:peptide ABC transporter substrate-binding protein [Schaalia suimastitidis]|uniref:peptide ABC transporter substrate-binding protein n=1 Tax=Schaalia suimastitidis TaxID=121163 RepID=UPI00041D3F89|nr:ABC transporter substrate-binding protein [Schaalia suimastitidis]
MNLKRTWLAAPAALALALSACAGDASTSSDTATETTSTTASTGIVMVNGSEPANPLIPANTNEVGGGKIIDLVMAGLVYYDAEGKTVLDGAESIETEDDITWTVKLKQDRKFSDGTSVKAKNYVEAWKMGAKEAMLSAYFYHDIVGADDEGVGDLTGLEVVDDYTFTITLKQPAADWADRLGYSAYYPLADSTLADPAAGGENPVGNGPYMLDGEGAWEHNVQIRLVPNPEYVGDNTAQNGGVTITFYSSQDAAYADLLNGNLDVLDTVPDSAFTTYETELEGRAVNQASAVFQSFTIPARLAHFDGEEGKLRRQAISMSINRDEVTEAIFGGTRIPAKDFSSPVVDGYTEKVPGNEVLTYNPEKAKELWAQADAISPWDGTFKIAYNSDGGHQAWVDAVTNQIKNTLGIQAEGEPYADFKSLRGAVTDRSIQTAFRTGWQADYPGQYNFLAPIYGTGAGSNDGDYSSAEFDKLLSEVFTQATHEESLAKLTEAQAVLMTDLPAIPLWYSNVTGGWSANVENVVFGWNSVPLYHQITKN